MSLFAKVAMLARSPRGKRAVSQAMRYAQSPQGRKQLAALKQRAATRRGRPKP